MPGKAEIERIFTDMSYNNGNTNEDLSKITTWLPNKIIGSVVNGQWKDTSANKAILKNSTPDFKIVLICSSTELVSTLTAQSKNDVPVDKNLAMYKEATLLDSLAVNLPLRLTNEIVNVAQKTSTKLLLPNEVDSFIMEWDLSQNSYSLEALIKLLRLLESCPSKKFAFAVQVNSESDSFRLLSTVYRICQSNSGAMKNNPIDILLFKEITEDIETTLLTKYGKIVLRRIGNVNSKLAESKLGLFSGGFDRRTLGHSNHFIVDSTADLLNSTEAITQKIWLSGSEKNGLHRSMLFVHQPQYKLLIDLLKNKLQTIRVSQKWNRDSDFIKVTVNKDIVLPKGAKSIPENSDLTGPTIIYDVGTSCDLIASTADKRNLGHLLIIVPYRSETELFSLANNHGSHNDVYLFSNNITHIKTICKKITGQTVSVNTCNLTPQSTQFANDGWCLFTNNESVLKGDSLSRETISEIIKKAEGASKRKATPTGYNSNDDANNFVLRFDTPIGICSVVLVQPNLLNKDAIIKLLSDITNNGNTCVVVNVGVALNPDISENLASNPNVFIADSIATSTADALNTLAATGKISTAVIYQKTASVNLANTASFNNVVVTSNGEINLGQLVTKKIVYL